MTTGKIIGSAYLVDPDAKRPVPPPADTSLVAIAATCTPAAAAPNTTIVAWVCVDPGRGCGDAPRFGSDVDLRPYFHTGDPVEIDPYQGLIRHLREGYAFPVRAVG
jgi:hypothetical protein